MHQQKKVAYFTEEELQSSPNVLDSVRSDGYQVVVITDQQKTKLETQVLTGGPQVRTMENYVQEYNASFEYKFVELAQLTNEERRIYDFTPKIFSLIGFPITDFQKFTFPKRCVLQQILQMGFGMHPFEQ